jgi:hypothetical protein
MISQTTIDAVRSATDIAELAREYGCKLRRSGDSYVTLCVFHREDTPSLRIHSKGDRRGHYTCFGCGASGNIFSFAAFTRGWSLPQDYGKTVEYLAFRAGVPIDSRFLTPVQRFADTQDRQMFPWWLQRRYAMIRGHLDECLKDGPPADKETWAWACCLNRMLLHEPNFVEFQGSVTTAERRAWQADIKWNAELDAVWMGLTDRLLSEFTEDADIAVASYLGALAR